MSKLVDFAIIMIALAFSALWYFVYFAVFGPIRWFRRHVYDDKAPFRSINGPYFLVLRSFSNRMATGHKVSRIIIDRDGRVLDVPEFLHEMPGLTVIQFLKAVASRANHPLVGISNGTSLNGVLYLVYTPEGRWFDAVQILAAHASAIIVIPDDSQALVKEIAYVLAAHSSKITILMPPSDNSVRWFLDIMKVFRVDGVDLSAAWADTQKALAPVGVKLPAYQSAGGILTWDGTERALSVSLPWDAEAFANLLVGLETKPSDAKKARAALSASGLRLLRYDVNKDVELDPSWNRFPFHPLPHIGRLEKMIERGTLQVAKQTDSRRTSVGSAGTKVSE